MEHTFVVTPTRYPELAAHINRTYRCDHRYLLTPAVISELLNGRNAATVTDGPHLHTTIKTHSMLAAATPKALCEWLIDHGYLHTMPPRPETWQLIWDYTYRNARPNPNGPGCVPRYGLAALTKALPALLGQPSPHHANGRDCSDGIDRDELRREQARLQAEQAETITTFLRAQARMSELAEQIAANDLLLTTAP